MRHVQDANGANRRVIATEDIQAKTLELHVICSSKTVLHDDTSKHPARARVYVQRKAAKDKKVLKFSGDAESVVSKVSGRTVKPDDVNQCAFTFFLHPEVSPPQLMATSAVAEVAASSTQASATPTPATAAAAPAKPAVLAVAGISTSSWKWSGDEALSPFWAIRRMTKLEMATENQGSGTVTKLVANCQMAERQMSHVDVGAYKGSSVSAHTTVTLPCITNPYLIPKGTELILERAHTTMKEKRGTTASWKDDPKKLFKKPKKIGNAGELSSSSAIEFI